MVLNLPLAIMLIYTLKDNNSNCIVIYISKFSYMLITLSIYNDWLGLFTI